MVVTTSRPPKPGQPCRHRQPQYTRCNQPERTSPTPRPVHRPAPDPISRGLRQGRIARPPAGPPCGTGRRASVSIRTVRAVPVDLWFPPIPLSVRLVAALLPVPSRQRQAVRPRSPHARSAGHPMSFIRKAVSSAAPAGAVIAAEGWGPGTPWSNPGQAQRARAREPARKPRGGRSPVQVPRVVSRREVMFVGNSTRNTDRPMSTAIRL